MNPPLKIGTRESQLAVWQATQVLKLLEERGISSELIFIKSEGDTDTVTPLYELGVQGIFTKALDSALLNNKIDIAVHSMKDVPIQPAAGIRQAAVLKRASFKDILVFKGDRKFIEGELDSPFTIHNSPLTIATSSIRRKAQWLHRYPDHTIESLRGNVNTRLRKLSEHNWNGVIFAAAGLERIGLRPENSIDLDWMLPAPAQGAITISCRATDDRSFEICQLFNDEATDHCTKEERSFLRALLGGCSTPISALASIENDKMVFKGNICSTNGKEKFDIEKTVSLKDSAGVGLQAARELLENEKVKQILFNILMPKNKIQILSTKVLDKKLIRLANAHHITIDEVPFIEIKNIKTPDVQKRIAELSEQSITAIFTSANAVDAVKEMLPAKPQWKVYCIGYKTKIRAEATFGNENIMGIADNGEQLAEEIIKYSTEEKMIFFCGNQRRNTLPDQLKKNGIDLEELMVYETIETPGKISKLYDGILFYSPSGVRSFFAKNTIEKNTQLFAIGTTTANDAKMFTGLPVIAAEYPDTTHLINLVIQHFTKIKSSECSN